MACIIGKFLLFSIILGLGRIAKTGVGSAPIKGPELKQLGNCFLKFFTLTLRKNNMFRKKTDETEK
jgi:hypothetical protein